MNEREPRSILVVEDDPAQLLALSDRLTREGFDVSLASDGLEGMKLATTGGHDLVILDVMLPGNDGFEIASAMRRAGRKTPILMLTARGGVADKVVGLDLGADDYLTKPFEFIELMARIGALLRRTDRDTGRAPVNFVEFGDVSVDFRSAEARRAGEVVPLSAKELQLLRYLAENSDTVVSRDDVLDSVWGVDATPTTRTIDVHIARLRNKLETNPAAPEFILTVRGMGYKLAHSSRRRSRDSGTRQEGRI